MGFWTGLDGPVGKMLAPTAPATPGYERTLLGVANEARGQASAYAPIVGQRMTDIVDTTDETRRLRATNAVDLAQSMGRQQYSQYGQDSTPFARAMRKAKAMSKISQMGDAQVQRQSLSDRFAMARFGNNVRNGVGSDLSNLAAGQAEANATSMRSQQQQSAAYANAGGALAGAAGSYIRNSMTSKK